MKAELDAAGRSVEESRVAMVASEEKVKAIAAEIAPLESRLKEMQGQVSTAEQAVEAASGVVEARRQLLRPLLQLTSAQ